MRLVEGVMTNLGGNYSICDGNYKKTMTMHLKRDCHETDREMFDRLKHSYKRITFYYVTTRIRGYYEVIAYCK